MPRKEIVNLGTAAPNPNLSPATRFGNLVFVAGQTGRHPETGELGKDVREQTRNVLERIKSILTAAGTSLDNVLTATTHLTSVANLAAYNEEYAKYFPTNKPARTTVTVAALNTPELLDEITVIACLRDWRAQCGWRTSRSGRPTGRPSNRRSIPASPAPRRGARGASAAFACGWSTTHPAI